MEGGATHPAEAVWKLSAKTIVRCDGLGIGAFAYLGAPNPPRARMLGLIRAV